MRENGPRTLNACFPITIITVTTISLIKKQLTAIKMLTTAAKRYRMSTIKIKIIEYLLKEANWCI